ncbi:tRNA(adenine34) deaminase, partial [Ascoidea rubescens DSM 1968]
FKFMRLALNQAEFALSQNEVPVGCIFVYNDNEVIATGSNSTNESLSGITHAELTGITKILKKFNLLDLPNKTAQDKADYVSNVKALFAKIDLYVTVEPCIMCASALRQLGLRRVIFGCTNDRFGGNGSILSINTDSHSNPHLPIYQSYPGIGKEEAIILLRKFYVQQNVKSPNPQTSLSNPRILKYNELPKINFHKFLSSEDFIQFFG